MVWIIALMTLAALGLPGVPVHESVLARGPTSAHPVTVCNIAKSARRTFAAGRVAGSASLPGLPDICRGWWSLRLSAGYPQPRFRKSLLPASCRAEALARDADRNHSDEVLGFGLDPRLKANGADRRTLGLGIYVMRRAPHQHHPPLVLFRIDLVGLHDDLVLGLRDTSAQVLLGEGDQVGTEHDRPVMHLVLRRQRHRPIPAVVDQAPDPPGAEQFQACGLIQLLHHAPGTHSRARRSRTTGRTGVGLMGDVGHGLSSRRSRVVGSGRAWWGGQPELSAVRNDTPVDAPRAQPLRGCLVKGDRSRRAAAAAVP